MGFNPSPEVAAARDFGRKFDADRVIILYTTEIGQIGYASYGKTRALCDATKLLADAAYEAVRDAISGAPPKPQAFAVPLSAPVVKSGKVESHAKRICERLGEMLTSGEGEKPSPEEFAAYVASEIREANREAATFLANLALSMRNAQKQSLKEKEAYERKVDDAIKRILNPPVPGLFDAP